jgi:Protein of unknown function (DUF429)
MPRVIAVDWSGKEKRAYESIWRAVAVDGQLLELENGLERDELIAWVIDYAQRHQHTVVGLDFAFSYPAWFCAREGWSSGRDVWAAMHERANALLAACEPPFWGRAGKRPEIDGAAFRETESQIKEDFPIQPKSVFQIAGAGAVGTGSVRGMCHLADLARAGLAIWPFDPPAWPLVVEIYPRLLTGKVTKNRHLNRREYLRRCFSNQNPVLLERAAGSEDAFDAAVSAITMASHIQDLESLPAFPPGSPKRIEGCIWKPATDTTESGGIATIPRRV